MDVYRLISNRDNIQLNYNIVVSIIISPDAEPKKVNLIFLSADTRAEGRVSQPFVYNNNLLCNKIDESKLSLFKSELNFDSTILFCVHFNYDFPS